MCIYDLIAFNLYCHFNLFVPYQTMHLMTDNKKFSKTHVEETNLKVYNPQIGT